MDNCRTVNLTHQLKPNVAQAHQELTPTATATLATALAGGTLHANTSYVRVQCGGGTVRMTFDGATAPTTAKGFLLIDGAERFISREEWALCTVILASSTPKLQVQGFKL